jgi:NADP-dependent 3-hydroxy acid dehydrogenase YdfG
LPSSALQLVGCRDTVTLSADDLAATIVFALTQPPGVDVSTLTVRRIGSPR